MIVTVFSPCGIVSATMAKDVFREPIEDDDKVVYSEIDIEGLPHTYTFWDKYVLTYNWMDKYYYDARFRTQLMLLESKWTQAPVIKDFMPYLKKMIADNKSQIIGVVSAYDEENGQKKPFVYQILGEDIRRVNIDNKGNLNYNFICLEKNPIVGRILRKTKILNGDQWEMNKEVKIRCDLYSVTKSLDLCKFMLRTNFFFENINRTTCDSHLSVEVAIVTTNSIEIKTVNI